MTVPGLSPGADKWRHRPLAWGCWSCSCGAAAEAGREAGWDTALLQSLSLPLLTWLHLLPGRHLALPIASAVLADVRMRWPCPPGPALLRLQRQRRSSAATGAWAAAAAAPPAAAAAHPGAADPAAAADPDPAAAAAAAAATAVTAAAADPAAAAAPACGCSPSPGAASTKLSSLATAEGMRQEPPEVTAARLSEDTKE